MSGTADFQGSSHVDIVYVRRALFLIPEGDGAGGAVRRTPASIFIPKEETMMKKTMMAALTMVSAAAVLTACGGSAPAASTAAETESTAAIAGTESSAEPSKAEGEGKVYKVGILKFVDHPSLNQIEDNLCAELDSLSGDGVKFDYADYRLNGQADGSVLNQMTAQLLADGVDVIVPIATPAAQIVQAATEGMDIPVVFSAVSDPVSAKLVDSMEKPGKNITGTSDFLNTDAIMDLIFAANADTDYVGLLYSKSEDASAAPIQAAKAYLDAKGVKYIEKTGTTTDEVSQAVDALIAEGVDAVFTPTDNTIQKAELAFFEKLQDAKIPHFGGADSFALNGAFAGYGVDYAKLGRATADMVAEILDKGAVPAETAVQTFDNGIATINTETLDKLGMNDAEIRKAFAPYCTEIVETQTKKEFAK